MQNKDNRRDRSPCSFSNLGSSNSDETAKRSTISRLVKMLITPREAGGFGGYLRYYDLELLLRHQQPLCSTGDTERLDDCWYDMVRGRSESVVHDMTWATQCIQKHLFDDCMEFSFPICTPSPQHKEIYMTPTPVGGTSNEKEASSVTQREICDMPLPLQAQEKPNIYTTTKEKPNVSSPLRVSRQSRSSVTSGRRKSSPVTSTRSKCDPSSANEVFERLIKDARCRRQCLSSLAASPKSPSKKDEVSAPARSTPRRPRVGSPQWGKATKSFVAKLTTQPELPDKLETAPPTPRVERRTPMGPSPYVPPGYIEAVARLRRFAASRTHKEFVDSLREQTPFLAVEEQTPILRLPVPEVGNARAVVDIRLATPVRQSQIAYSQDVPQETSKPCLYSRCSSWKAAAWPTLECIPRSVSVSVCVWRSDTH